MIRCSKCGALNRDGSRFCNECGGELQAARIRCPMCGAVNPVGSVFCDKCHARLVSAEGMVPPKKDPVMDTGVGMKALSLPTRSSPDEESEPRPHDETFPDWLQGLLDETPSQTSPAERKASPPPFVEEDENEDEVAPGELPDWLSGVDQDNAEGGPSAEQEFFVSDEVGTSEEASPAVPVHNSPGGPIESERDETPDWLTGHIEETDAPALDTPTGEFPDWLRDLAADDSETSEIEDAPSETPDWLAAMAADSHAAPSVEKAAQGKIPDWLTEDQDTTPEPKPAAQAQAPATLSDAQPKEDAEEELPDWLADAQTESQAPAAPEPEARPEMERAEEESEDKTEDELPNWLAGLQAESPAPEAQPTIESATDTEPEEELPDWLADVQAESPAPETQPEIEPAAATEPEDKIPDWLAGLQSESQAPELEMEPAADAEPEEELPDWLASVQGESPGVTEAETGLDEKPSAPFAMSGSGEELEMDTEDDLPDWLASIQGAPESATTQSETPLDEAEPTPFDITESGEDEGMASGAQPEEAEALPDWLSGMQAEGPDTEPVAVSTELPESLEEQAEDLPNWLGDLKPTEIAEEKRAEPSPFPDQGKAIDEIGTQPEAREVPGSIQEEPPERPEREQAPISMAEESEDVGESEIPEWLRDLGPAPVKSEDVSKAPLPEGLEQADLPSWLSNLQPPGTGPLPEHGLSEEEIEELTEKGLVRAEIPEWVETLRPTGEATEITRTVDVEPEAIIEPEVEGPLSGMQNALASRPLVDMPADFQLALRLEPPDHLVEEAQLWQELLERPPSEEHIVRQKPTKTRWPESLLRAGLLLVLCAAVVVVIWGFLPDALFSQPTQPNVTSLVSVVDTLQAGDTVALVLEYGPAEAGEMQSLVEATLDHLLAREAQVQILTTVPVGEALIQERLAWAEETILADEPSTVESLGYWAGGSSGVASFLASTSNDEKSELLLVVAARPERLRWWIEQNTALGDAAHPLGVAVSAAAGPMARPYLQSTEVDGWLVGIQGAAAYWQARDIPNINVTRQANAVTFTQWVAAGLILIGAGASLIFRKRKRSA